MMMKTRVLRAIGALVVAFFFAGNMFAQDPHFSQYNETPVYVNPALCATSYDMRVIANYKSQWKSIATPYKSFGASAEFAMRHKKLNRRSYWTTGLNMYNDISGDANYSALHIGLILGTCIKSGKHGKISMAITGAFDQRSINGTKLTWDSQYNGYKFDPSLQGEVLPTNRFYYGDLGAGFNYHFAKSERYISAADGNKFDVGMAIFHANIPFYSFYENTGENLDMKMVVHGNFVIAMPQINSNLIPSFLVMKQGPHMEEIFGFMFRYILKDPSVHSGTIKPMALSLGAQYRMRDALSPQVLFEYDKYAIGASYDVNLSGLTPFTKTKGGFEITLRYNWNPGYGMAVGNTIGPRPTPGKTQSSTGF